MKTMTINESEYDFYIHLLLYNYRVQTRVIVMYATNRTLYIVAIHCFGTPRRHCIFGSYLKMHVEWKIEAKECLD